MRIDWIERLLRGLYSAALYVLAPVTLYHLIWRGFRQPAYLQRWSERYAIYSDAPHPRTLWIHAVSVGEVNAALPLVQALRRGRPDLRLLVTTITPTGSERVAALWKDQVEHVYLPYDLAGAVGRLLDHYRPIAALIMETELWRTCCSVAATAACPASSSTRGCRSVRCAAIACWRHWSGARCARCARWPRRRMRTPAAS